MLLAGDVLVDPAEPVLSPSSCWAAREVPAEAQDILAVPGPWVVVPVLGHEGEVAVLLAVVVVPCKASAVVKLRPSLPC